ncbi:MAG: hypothetical protein IKO47_11525 [Ruminococcus sp.]|nr:hypothetical protein [Ruminococcus sp.]
MEINDIKDTKEKYDFLKAFLKLEAQRRSPSREGMIDALKEALTVACIDIKNVEASRGETTPTPWENIPNEVLFGKLSEYQQGMYQHAVNKFGEEAVKKLLEQGMQ